MDFWSTGPGAVYLMFYLTLPFLALFLAAVWRAYQRSKRQITGGPPHASVVEVGWLFSVGIVWTLINLYSLGWIPSVGGHAASAPQQSLTIVAGMWYFNISAPSLKPNVPTEVVAWSVDTMHSAGIYDPDGKLVATLMLMPGMRERAVLIFDKPGVYTVRCLEFCGDGHAFMKGRFVVG